MSVRSGIAGIQLSSCLTCVKYIMTYYDSIKFVRNCKKVIWLHQAWGGGGKRGTNHV